MSNFEQSSVISLMSFSDGVSKRLLRNISKHWFVYGDDVNLNHFGTCHFNGLKTQHCSQHPKMVH